MKALAIVGAAGALTLATPAQGAAGWVYWDCSGVRRAPSSIDLNCQRVDAALSSLRWEGRSAVGSFRFPSYSVGGGEVLISLPARVKVSRPRRVGGTKAFTQLTVGLQGSRRDREGLPREIRYVLTCDISQGWVPAAASEPC